MVGYANWLADPWYRLNIVRIKDGEYYPVSGYEKRATISVPNLFIASPLTVEYTVKLLNE